MNSKLRSTTNRAAGALLICIMLVSAPEARAQSASSGRISGQATDRQNAMVAGAEVVLIDTTTNSRRRSVTNEVGCYFFLNLHPGVYDITVSKSGFSQARLSGQTVAVGLELTLNPVL